MASKLKPHLLVIAMVSAMLLLVCQAVAVQRLRNEARTLEALTPPESSPMTGKVDESDELVSALVASVESRDIYGDVNALASAAGLSLSSYEEVQSVETNQAVLRTQEVALQATAAYPNLVAFLASLQAAHPNVALVSATVDRKAGESGRGPAGAIASAELLASIRLRAYWAVGAVDSTRAP